MKLNATRDGLRNLGQLAMHRMRRDRQVAEYDNWTGTPAQATYDRKTVTAPTFGS